MSSASCLDLSTAKEIGAWIEHLTPLVTAPAPRCFLHNDSHEMNVMCTRAGGLLALIDWGDAGWGDPALEFSQIPLGAVPIVMAAYEAEAPGRLGDLPEARIIWDKLDYALEALPAITRRLTELRRFIEGGGGRWRETVPGR